MLFKCTLYEEERGRWRGDVRELKDGMYEYEEEKRVHYGTVGRDMKRGETVD